MFNISSFLEKFTKQITKEEDTINGICEILHTHTGIVFPQDSFKIQNNILFLNVSPGIKNKVFMTKKAILDNFSTNIHPKIIDIR